jgi:hypothetical protein
MSCLEGTDVWTNATFGERARPDVRFRDERRARVVHHAVDARTDSGVDSAAPGAQRSGRGMHDAGD